jgi:predicted nucleotide-binding protein (sugar kinase/HSP70/actin superfamily)
LSRLYHATIFREKDPGQTDKIKEQYITAALPCIKRRDADALFSLLQQAVASFNAIPVRPGNFPAVGLVGEIYLKYNSFSNYDVITWLHGQAVEVIVPPIIDFMIQGLVNRQVKQQKNVMRGNLPIDLLSRAAGFMVKRYIRRIETIMANFRYYRPLHDLHDSAAQAARIIDLVNQYGEGWLISAEIAAFAQAGVGNVISVQPFGCIANHVIAKGVEKKIKQLFPGMNILFLDFDAGTSQINIYNRLHYLMKNARESLTASRPVMTTADTSHHKTIFF